MSFGFWTDGRIDVAVSRHGTPVSLSDPHAAMASPFLTVGSDPACDLVLDSGAIPSKAFCLCLDGQDRLWGAMLVRKSSKSKVGFRRVDVQQGLRIGEYRLHFNIQAESTESDRNYEDHRRCVLKWRTGNDTHLKRLRPNRPIMLGRDLPSQLVIDHVSISTAHCGLVFDGEQLWVVDVGSTNKIRTADGIADVLCLGDRQKFAAGRVQFKTAMATAARNELENYQKDLQTQAEVLRNEQELWLSHRDQVNRENEQWLQQLDDRESKLAEDMAALEQDRTEKMSQLEARSIELDQRQAQIEELEKTWMRTQEEADNHWQSVAEEVKRHKQMIREQQMQLQRDNELSVVQRIRTQRELKEREQRLDEREKELIRREVQIEAAQRRVPRDVANPDPENVFPSESISDSTLLSANDFVDILDRAIDQDTD